MRNVSLFYDYVDMDGVNVIKTRLDELGPKATAKLNTKLNVLEQMSRTEWGSTSITEVLSGDKDGLIAVRVKYQGIQYRLLGYDGPHRGEFTLLAWGKERNNKYIPLDIGRKAFERRTATEANPFVRRTRHDFG